LRFAVFLLLVFVAVWAGVRVANATVESDVFEGRSYEVHAGDTLWQIAVDEYGEQRDLRAAVLPSARRTASTARCCNRERSSRCRTWKSRSLLPTVLPVWATASADA